MTPAEQQEWMERITTNVIDTEMRRLQMVAAARAHERARNAQQDIIGAARLAGVPEGQVWEARAEAWRNMGRGG